MNKEERKKLFEDYCKSIDKQKYNKALKQNRLLYNEIFIACENSNGNRKVLDAGLDQLEIEATEILDCIKLNNPEEF